MRRWVVAWQLVGIGFYIVACIVLPVLLGVWLDNRFDTGMTFTLVGPFLGLAAAFLGTYRMVSPMLKDKDDEEEDD